MDGELLKWHISQLAVLYFQDLAGFKIIYLEMIIPEDIKEIAAANLMRLYYSIKHIILTY